MRGKHVFNFMRIKRYSQIKRVHAKISLSNNIRPIFKKPRSRFDVALLYCVV